MIKTRLLLLSLLLVIAMVALGVTDPEVKECKHQCRVQQKLDEGQTRACLQQCERFHQEKQQKERQEGGGDSGISSSLWDWDNPTDPEKQHKKCLEQCQRESVGQYRQQECRRQCEEQLREQEREQGRGGGSSERYQGREQEEEQQQGQQGQQQEENPYVFEEQHFTTKIQTQHGRVRALPKFTERSKLLKGIENYRLTILEAEPNTFILPNHWDAEAVFFVASGIA